MTSDNVISAEFIGNMCYMLYLNLMELYVLVPSLVELNNGEFKLFNHCVIFVLFLVQRLIFIQAITVFIE